LQQLAGKTVILPFQKLFIMLQISYIREHPADVKNRLQIKNFKQIDLIDNILSIDEQRRSTQKQLDDSLAQSNTLSAQIGNLFKSGKAAEAAPLKEQAALLKEQGKNLEVKLQDLEKQQNDMLVLVPNLPHPDVKQGHSAEDNEIVHAHGDISEYAEQLKPHWEISDDLGLIDFEWGSKITGSGFPVYKGRMAKLQRALIQYFLDKGVEAGYFEVQPPYLINEESGFGTGQLPDKDGQMYHMPVDNLFLIPTAEVPVTNIYRDVILRENELPVKLVAYSACFRREAGSYGKDVRGLNRLHQFDKVEIVRIEKPENGYAALDEMCKHVGGLIESLGLPYRILRLCGGDISFTSAMTFDFEVWAAGQKRWLEVSSVSNFETFQSNRMKLRYKESDGKAVMPHTLNGSALALPRIVAAIIENNQAPQGVKVPDVLKPYTGFEFLTNKTF
jgi:seryl-tRNA synthetase